MPINISQFPLTTVVDASSKMVWLDPTVTTGQVTSGAGGTEFLMGASDTLNRLLPAQAGQTGKVLGTNGTVPSWVAGGGGPAVPVSVANGGTGLTAFGTALQVLRVNAGGTGLEYGTVSGGSGSPGGSPGDIQVNTAGAFGGTNLGALEDTLHGTGRGTVPMRGASLWGGLAPGPAGYTLGSGGAGADLIWRPSRKPFAIVTTIGTKQTGTAPLSLFAGSTLTFYDGTTAAGAPIIPANRLGVGSVINFRAVGDIDMLNADSVTLSVLLGGVTLMTGQVSPATSTVTGRWWGLEAAAFCVQVAGASGTGRGSARFTAFATSAASLCSGLLTTVGGGAASGIAAVNTTIANAFDIQLTAFSSASGSDGIRITECEIFLDG